MKALDAETSPQTSMTQKITRRAPSRASGGAVGIWGNKTQEEYARAQAVNGGEKPRSRFMVRAARPDIRPVDEAHDMEQRDEGNEPPGAFANRIIIVQG
jgi:hypothetical protein